MATIEDLLNALNGGEFTPSLENTKDTWRRIGEKDSFSELGLPPSELESFLQEWINNNPYNNI